MIMGPDGDISIQAESPQWWGMSCTAFQDQPTNPYPILLTVGLFWIRKIWPSPGISLKAQIVKRNIELSNKTSL